METLSSYCVLVVVEPRPAVAPATIIRETTAQLERDGVAFWTYRSQDQKADHFQSLGQAGSGKAPCYFLSVGKGYTAKAQEDIPGYDAATHYAADGQTWRELRTPVIGQLDNNPCALVLGEIEPRSGESFNLWAYGTCDEQGAPVRFSSTVSAVGAVQNDTRTHPNKMKTNPRPLLAVGFLVAPFAVWLKNEGESPAPVDYVEDGIMPTILGNLDL
jgi:hypothetical protein